MIFFTVNLLFATVLIPLSNVAADSHGIKSGTAIQDIPRHHTLINKTNDEFLRLQMQAIRAYQRSNPARTWRCSYEDHVTSLSSITPAAKEVEQLVLGMSRRKYHKFLSGATSIAMDGNDDYEFLLFWDGVYVNTLEYYNVLYGGSVYFHVGIGFQHPTSYYERRNEDFIYYDLVSCLPFPDWIRAKKKHIKEILLIPRNNLATLRNAVQGIAAILPQLPMVTSNITSYFDLDVAGGLQSNATDGTKIESAGED